MLTRDAIFATNDVVTEVVPTPEWGGEVIVRSMNSRERNEYMATHARLVTDPNGNHRVEIANDEALMVARCAVDDKGERIFTDKDAQQLAEKNGAVIHRLVQVIERLSGVKDSDVKDAEKN